MTPWQPARLHPSSSLAGSKGDLEGDLGYVGANPTPGTLYVYLTSSAQQLWASAHPPIRQGTCGLLRIRPFSRRDHLLPSCRLCPAPGPLARWTNGG